MTIEILEFNLKNHKFGRKMLQFTAVFVELNAKRLGLSTMAFHFLKECDRNRFFIDNARIG
jgi:hypothetical protein